MNVSIWISSLKSFCSCVERLLYAAMVSVQFWLLRSFASCLNRCVVCGVSMLFLSLRHRFKGV